MSAASSREIYNELRKLIDVPPHYLVRRLVLTLEVENFAQVEIVMTGQQGTGEPITKRYMLEQIPEQALQEAKKP